jgi:hypothetical protein
MSDFATYSPDQVVITAGSLLIRGYAKDTFVEVERDEDTFMKYVGAGGDACRTRNLNRGGKVTITLMAVSPTNDDLWGLGFIDENQADSFFELMIKDLSGNMLCHAEIAWIKKWPKVERGKESGTIQWEIDCAQLEINPSGNTEIIPLPVTL